ncbi:hypothetical protein A5707_01110 [Mycobacterium kyorinense]|uniref:Proline rich protein n=1 Tax=Mycobacterium kyorinense TaxID=487514 RepID=A0A1A2ZHX4_9MYCO|nr:hypothetical protein [Mycobacterium kyorinense]OBI49082.1 hypothetical protein A5707_01110 [Mycobacterium kyorinense]
MKLTLNPLKKPAEDKDRTWPGYFLGGHVRTSTAVLVVAFIGLWWIYDTHQHSDKSESTPSQVPATQVVPPGFVPDPNYTWVPRSRLQQPPPVTTTSPPTTTPPTTTTTTTTPPPPPFQLPVLPPPFGPGTSTTPPPPGPVPAPPHPAPFPPPPAPPR